MQGKKPTRSYASRLLTKGITPRREGDALKARLREGGMAHQRVMNIVFPFSFMIS